MHVNGQITYKNYLFTLMDLPRADQLGDREGLYQANRAMANSLRNCQVARLKNYHSACGDSRTYRLNYIIHNSHLSRMAFPQGSQTPCYSSPIVFDCVHLSRFDGHVPPDHRHDEIGMLACEHLKFNIAR